MQPSTSTNISNILPSTSSLPLNLEHNNDSVIKINTLATQNVVHDRVPWNEVFGHMSGQIAALPSTSSYIPSLTLPTTVGVEYAQMTDLTNPFMKQSNPTLALNTIPSFASHQSVSTSAIASVPLPLMNEVPQHIPNSLQMDPNNLLAKTESNSRGSILSDSPKQEVGNTSYKLLDPKYEVFSPMPNSHGSPQQNSPMLASSVGASSYSSSDTESKKGALDSSPGIATAAQTCAVCGDAASGYHYDVSSCNGCKTFFRRTVVAGRKFVCRNGGNCKFDKDQRCACRACRFQQCVAVGMNPDAIQYEPSANLTLSVARKRFQKLTASMSRREKKGGDQDNESGVVVMKSKVQNLPQELFGIQDEILKYIGLVLRLEEKHDRLRASTFFPYEENMSLAEAIKLPTAFGDAEKYQLVEKWPPRPISDIPRRDYKKFGLKFWFFMDLYLGIEYLKTFEVFQELSVDEKISLIKSVSVSNLLLTQVYPSYIQNCDGILYPDGTYPIYHGPKSNLTQLEKEMRRGCIEQMNALKPDKIQFSLLRAITCLNDACEGLSDVSRERISEHRGKYTKILLQYLQNRHGMEAGTKRFGETMMSISYLFRQQQVICNYLTYRSLVLNNVDPSVLLREIVLNK
ncbi:zinc finger, c4 type (two domains) domain-containing protein [Ditylenchus destructor]|nr:zinc finger, c4 type (two domains) domain-containing protein [Ditylenchus destructor]